MGNELVDEFYQQGYVVLDNFLTTEEVAELKEAGQGLLDSIPEKNERIIFSTTDSESAQNRSKYFIESGDKIRYFFEEGAVGPNGELQVSLGSAVNKVGHALHVLHPVFRKYTLQDERIKEVCWQLGLSDPAVAQSMFIYKGPGGGGPVTQHQDASYLHTEPVNVIGFWIALDDASLENGCLWIAPGSHKSGVHRRYIRNPDPSAEELLIYTSPQPIYQKALFKSVPVSKGACILLHGQIVHYSERNKSSNSRNAYTFHVIEQKNTKYSEDNWLQPTVDPFPRLYKKYC